MNAVKRIEKILIHLCGIGSISMLLIQALDWYNPNMGILDRNLWIMDAVCLCVILVLLLSVLLSACAKLSPGRKEHEK